MSHIRNPLKWNDAVFDGYSKETTELVLRLSDASIRIMIFENWEDSYPQTLEKLKKIKKGTRIRFATWNGYDELKWFCDIEKI